MGRAVRNKRIINKKFLDSPYSLVAHSTKKEIIYLLGGIPRPTNSRLL